MRKKYLSGLIAFLLLFCMTCSSAVFAEGGEQASSSGVSGEKPLSFLGITLEGSGENVADAVDIPLKPKFKLAFDKNVVNSLFWENNSKCFSLITDSGDGVPIKVTKVDDTIDFTQRQNIFIEPVSALQPGTAYRLFISPDLRAKNGVATIGGTTDGKGITISFKTTGVAAKPAESTASPPTAADNTDGIADKSATANAIDDTITTRDSTAENAELEDQKTEGAQSAEQSQTSDSLDANQTNNADKATADSEKNRFSSTQVIAGVGAILVIGWVVAEIIFKRKRRKQ